MENNQEKFLVIDGNSIMNRAFYGIKLLTTADGLYTNAVYGFLNIYYMMLDKLNPDYVAVAFDLKEPTFRHEMFIEYKAHRKMMPDELKMQMPLIKEVLTAMNVPIFEIKGFEADDILGTIASKNKEKNIFTYILTGDKDSLQLISDSTSIVMPHTKLGKTEYIIYTPEVLMEKQGITPKQVIDVKALMGDNSDNIPGIPGIGEKTAHSLVQSYESLEKIYEDTGKLKVTPKIREKLDFNKDIAFLSYKLATIETNVPLELNYNALRFSDVDMPKLTSIFNRLSFKKFLERYDIDGNALPATDNNIEFFKEFDNSNFTDISEGYNFYVECLDKDASQNNEIYVMLANSKKMQLENVLLIYTNNNFMYIDLNNSDAEIVKEVLKALTSNSCKKVGYDIKKIFNVCLKNDISDLSTFISDIKIAYYLLHASENNYEIENISYNLLGINIPIQNIESEDENKIKSIQTSLFDMENTDLNVDKKKELSLQQKKYIYACLKGVKYINSLLINQLEEKNLCKLYNEIEMPLVETLANIENNGMYVNKEKLLEFGKHVSKDISSVESKIYELAGEESFNINSPAQLGVILFEKLQLPVIKKTKKGYATDKETLEELIDKHEIIQYILDYRMLTKLKSTFVDALMECIGEDNRVHTTFMQTVTATGRLSSVEPNLQNIPVRTELGSKIRECFEAEGENIIIDADYSQIELRVLAHMANDSIMIDAFKQGIDIHSVTASQVFNIPLEDVTSEHRGRAKAVNFGIVYGISAFGLAKNINSTRSEASEYINNYLSKYYKVHEFMKKNVKHGKVYGYVSTMFGRIRYTEELNASNRNTVMFGERIAMNTPIQGTAADIIKKAMNDLYRNLKKNNLKAKIIMQVHDELIVEAPLEEKEKVMKLMKSSMESVIKLKVPLDVSINAGKSWGEAK